ncbi:MAG: YIP1 family protein [Clostridia bacterium]|nr:YIP1 family protein [Clostridia bacterium]
MKKILTKSLLFCVTFLLIGIFVFPVEAGATVPYTTYTYDIDAFMQESPDVYVPYKQITTASLIASLNESNPASAKYSAEDFGALATPKDVFVDDLNYVYIADTGNSRIVILDEQYRLHLIIKEFVNDQGVPDSLASPEGVFATETEIYVADTEKSRIVIFDKLGNFRDIVHEPVSEVMPENSVYKPSAVAVDSAGRIYVVGKATNYGIISLNRDGSFNGFVGAITQQANAWDMFWRNFQTQEQIDASQSVVSIEYNNITIDADGFVYATQSADTTQVPIKKLNPKGSDVLNRNGFHPPSGEVTVTSTNSTDYTVTGNSTIVDVALGQANTWSIIDQKRSRVFTYDSNGNLLFAFGDMGDQFGNIQRLTAMDYQGPYMLLLDESTNSITIYKRTEYGDLLISAVQSIEDGDYAASVDYYMGILQRNNNFDQAYIAIGDAKFREGDYVTAMQYYKYAYDQESYSEAYRLYRKDWMETNLWILAVIIVVVLVAVLMFAKWVNKVNARGIKYSEKRKWYEEVCYGFHVIVHPFDGFWDLKHEKRGSVRGATIILLLTVFTFVYQSVGRGFLYNKYEGTGVNYVLQISSIVLPVILLTVSNWCLTTLFDGEGSLSDVYIATCYSLLPVVMLVLPTVMVSNFVTVSEQGILTMIETIAWGWTALLWFFGMMVIHDYSLFKNIIITVATVIFMMFVMFVAVLFTSLLSRVFTFFYNIYAELSYRWS